MDIVYVANHTLAKSYTFQQGLRLMGRKMVLGGPTKKGSFVSLQSQCKASFQVIAKTGSQLAASSF